MHRLWNTPSPPSLPTAVAGKVKREENVAPDVTASSYFFGAIGGGSSTSTPQRKVARQDASSTLSGGSDDGDGQDSMICQPIGGSATNPVHNLNFRKVTNPYRRSAAATLPRQPKSPREMGGWTSKKKSISRTSGNPPNNSFKENHRLMTKTAKTTTTASTVTPYNYKYQEVVRGRKERQALPGHDCEECRGFLDAVCNAPGGEVFDKGQLVRECSRHRARHTPPETPDGFWELSFADERAERFVREEKEEPGGNASAR